MSINSSMESLAAANQSAADAFLRVSRIYLESVEQVLTLNISTLREAVEEGASIAASIGEVRNAGDLQSLQSGLAPALDTTMAYAQSLHEIATRAREELTDVMGEQFSQFSFNMDNGASATTASAAAATGAKIINASSAKPAGARTARKAA